VAYARRLAQFSWAQLDVTPPLDRGNRGAVMNCSPTGNGQRLPNDADAMSIFSGLEKVRDPGLAEPCAANAAHKYRHSVEAIPPIFDERAMPEELRAFGAGRDPKLLAREKRCGFHCKSRTVCVGADQTLALLVTGFSANPLVDPPPQSIAIARRQAP